VSGIRTNAAAELLGVSPNTLRSWERRFGYPKPRRSAGGHRQYELAELEALRRALNETHNISSAIEVARRRGEGPSTPSRLLDAFDRFDEALADRVMEESLAVRSVDRSVEDVLLPAVALAEERDGREAEREHARRWATGWLHSQRRVCAAATRDRTVLVLDASIALDHESLHVQALELCARRAGFATLALPVGLPPERGWRALRSLDPSAIVIAGAPPALDAVGRLAYSVRQAGSDAPIFQYRDSMPAHGDRPVPTLGSEPTEAAARLKQWADEGRVPHVVKVGAPIERVIADEALRVALR
jgi:DNA-binding transcriptional MerR regulator